MSRKWHCDMCDRVIVDPTTALVLRKGTVNWAGSEVVLCSLTCIKDWLQ